MRINTYAEAEAYLGRKEERPAGNNTRLIRRSADSIAVRLHQTDVVTYHSNGEVELATGGWRTHTTKARINDFTPVSVQVWSDRGRWWISARAWDSVYSVKSAFYEGVRVKETGQILNPKLPTPTDNQRQRQLDAAVRRYIKAYAAHIAENGLQEPSGGDCWGCLFGLQNRKGIDTGQKPTFGRGKLVNGKLEVEDRTASDEPMGVDHYLSHLCLTPDSAEEEFYFVPSLLANAILARGYRDPGFIWHSIKARPDWMVEDVLRSFFKKLKPALLAELEGQPLPVRQPA